MFMRKTCFTLIIVALIFIAGEYAAAEDAKININTASANELLRLSQIGEKKAEAIVAYRDEHSSFATIDNRFVVQHCRNVKG